MEQANDGFTFRRVSTNRVERAELGCFRGRTMVDAGTGAFEIDGFTFRKVSGREKGRSEPVEKRGSGKSGPTVIVRGGKTAGEGSTVPAVAAECQAEPSFIFKTLKKRRTIRLEESIDLSTESGVNGEESGINDTTLLSTIEDEGRRGLVMPITHPRAEEVASGYKLKPNEIHKKVPDNNVNSLIKECVLYLKDDESYTKEIAKHCDANYFSDIDYKRNIEGMKERIEQVQSEISKWNEVYGGLETVHVEPIVRPPAPEVYEFNSKALIEEFDVKANRLKQLESRLRYFLEHSKAKSEAMLKNIFGAVEDRSVNALFLLKALSKLGK